MVRKMKTTPKFQAGDLVWFGYYGEELDHELDDAFIHDASVGPYLVLDVIHESVVLRDNKTHGDLDIPAILFAPNHPQWYYILLTDFGTLETPMREDYLAIFSKISD